MQESDTENAAGHSTQQLRPRCNWMTAGLLFVTVALTWLAFVFLGPYAGPFIIVIFFAIPFFLLRKKRYVVCLLWFLLCPLSVYFAWGAVWYWQGRAAIVFHGLPGTESLNIDPVLRCERATCGCVSHGYEWVWKVPNNSAVRLMTLLFGPMPGAYIGPYPTKEEAFEALQNAIPISPKDLMSDLFVVQGRQVQLDKGVGKGVLAHMLIVAATEDEQWYADFVEEYGEITGAIWAQQCLILRIPSEMLDSGTDVKGPSARIVVIDCEKGRPFAYYAEGGYYHNYPPVKWRKND